MREPEEVENSYALAGLEVNLYVEKRKTLAIVIRLSRLRGDCCCLRGR